MKLQYAVILGVALVALGFFLSRYTMKPEVVTHTEYLPGKTDTTIIHDTTTIFASLPATIDTVYIDSTAVEVAHADTLIVKDSSSVNIDVTYYSRPLNRFDILAELNVAHYSMLRVDTLKVETIKTFPCDPKWYERFHLGVGYGATYYDNKVQLVPSVGIFYEIF